MTHIDSYYRRFIAISVFLTGFDSAELRGTGMGQTYFEVILLNSDPDDVRDFFEAVQPILAPGQSKHRIEQAIAADLMPVDSYRALARSIVVLWYTGNWAGTPVSSEAYKQGLMWAAAETHPAGAKQPGYGSWASAPISIKTKQSGTKHGQ